MIIGGGCFWCIEAAFNQVNGVFTAISGYCGGEKEQANYDAVCTGKTHHVEVVKIDFDNTIISFNQLLHLFFTLHDATQINRQGNDIGYQYRSVIYYQSTQQKNTAHELIKELNQQQIFKEDVVTAVEPSPPFYPAEKYHQGYYLKNPTQGYCMAIVAPKFQKFKMQHNKLLK